MNRPSQFDDRVGFTLVELMVVVIVIAIAAALVVPQMSSSQEITAQAAARMLISDLTYAQNEAVANQAERKVIFDTANNTYQLTDGDDTPLTSPWQGGSYVVDLDNSNRYSGVTLDGVDFGGGQTLVFDGLGSPDNGGTVELSADGRSYRVTVTPFTGRITVESFTGG